MAKKKGSKLSLKGLGRHRWALLGAAGVGAYFLLRGSGGGNDQVKIADQLKPASVAAGETISMASYRVIAEQRPGMTYDPVVQGSIGGPLTFVVSKGGMCTKNVVQVGGRNLVEVR